MLQNIRIVLVETSHTGNMGSVARAMKTMGLTNLWLVNPLVKPDSQAIATPRRQRRDRQRADCRYP